MESSARYALELLVWWRGCVYLGERTRSLIGRVGRLRGGYALPTLGRSGKLSWCSNGLTGAEVQVRLAMGVRGAFLETDPRGELLDRAELAVCLDIIGAHGTERAAEPGRGRAAQRRDPVVVAAREHRRRE